MNLMPLANLLEQAGLGKKAKTIFLNMMPPEAPSGILLRNRLTGTKIDYEMRGYYKTKFIVVIRAADFVTGEALSNKVSAALTLSEQTVEGMYFNYCRPETQPIVFPLSKGNLLEFFIEFDVCFVQ